ncbi:MAG: VanW family protein, partial [Armatimonadota bacterium]
MSRTERAPSDDDADEPRRPRRAIWFAVSLAILGLGAGTTGAAFGVARRAEGRIAPGVRIAGVPVGRMDAEAARESLLPWARARMTRSIVLVAPVSKRTWRFALSELAGRFDIDAAVAEAVAVGERENPFERLFRGDSPRNVDIEPQLRYDPDRLVARLRRIADEVKVAPVDARMRPGPKGALRIVRKERPGYRLDIEATRAALEADGLADGAEVDLAIRTEAPRVDSTILSRMGVLLASYHTDYASSSANRKSNVALAASKIDGLLLAPGESFSYNKSVGPRVADQGWKLAHQFQDGQVVDGIGGGVCQVSSTLYNAVLLAGLKVEERHNHSMPVAYLDPGRDATVSYGALDFRFSNSTAGPIYVSADANGRRLTFRVYGDDKTASRRIRVVT